jgi:hypothetical protein
VKQSAIECQYVRAKNLHCCTLTSSALSASGTVNFFLFVASSDIGRDGLLEAAFDADMAAGEGLAGALGDEVDSLHVRWAWAQVVRVEEDLSKAAFPGMPLEEVDCR